MPGGLWRSLPRSCAFLPSNHAALLRGPLRARCDSERFSQTPRVVKGSVGPAERVETGTGRRRGGALQGDIFQNLRAATLPFGSELFRRDFESREDGRIR